MLTMHLNKIEVSIRLDAVLCVNCTCRNTAAKNTMKQKSWPLWWFSQHVSLAERIRSPTTQLLFIILSYSTFNIFFLHLLYWEALHYSRSHCLPHPRVRCPCCLFYVRQVSYHVILSLFVFIYLRTASVVGNTKESVSCRLGILVVSRLLRQKTRAAFWPKSRISLLQLYISPLN